MRLKLFDTCLVIRCSYLYRSANAYLGILKLVSTSVEGLHPELFLPKYYAALSWLSFLSAATISIWFVLLRRPGVKVSVLNVWKFLIPVLGAILSWIILENKNPDLPSNVGMFIIAVSLITLNLSGRREIKVVRKGDNP